MARSCTVCPRPDRVAIDVDLLDRSKPENSFRAMASRYSQSKASLQRHYEKCMSATREVADRALADQLSRNGTAVRDSTIAGYRARIESELRQMDKLAAQALALSTKAEKVSEFGVAVQGVAVAGRQRAEIVKGMTTLGQAAGEFSLGASATLEILIGKLGRSESFALMERRLGAFAERADGDHRALLVRAMAGEFDERAPGDDEAIVVDGEHVGDNAA